MQSRHKKLFKMANTRKEAWDEYQRTGYNNISHDLTDRDEIATLTGWDCARDNGRAEAFREYNRTGRNNSEYDLNDRNRIASILDKYCCPKSRCVKFLISLNIGINISTIEYCRYLLFCKFL